jgi:flagellar hook-associated protein 3 FlgL
MRVTNSMVLRSTVRDLNQSLSRLQSSQTDLSTGRVVRKASDDPTKATAAMALRNQVRRSEQRDRSLADAKGWLNTAGATLMSGLDLVNRVKELTVQGSNTGAGNPSARAAIASEISSIRDELISLANTQYIDRSIFNGSADGKAYNATSATYLGNAAVVKRDVAPDTVVTVNLTGEDVFGQQASSTGDLFAVLNRLSTAIASGDGATIAAEHTNLDAAASRIAQATGEVGSRAARLDSIQSRADAQRGELIDALSGIEDTDIAEALMNVKARENAYTAALQAAARIIPPSLLDYLR